jgi:predicted ATPase/class 3 adenylate cyclase/DNA-binding CsgD family transcriptional regulator
MIGMGTDEEPACSLPAGTVTFLLTDIEGSTRLWEAAPELMPPAVARHYEILHEAIARHDGVRPLEQGEGDSVVAAFTRAGDAMGAALDAQRALVAEAWPRGLQLRVRMALHSGDAQLRDEGSYFGPAVIRCARLRAVGHGGQVLLSHATEELVADGLPEGVALVDLGAHRLRDLGRPEHVWALTHPDLLVVSEPLRSLDALPNNLPVEQSSFVGREQELAEIANVFASTRLLTLTGAGGCGKTRVALQTAAGSLERFPDGVWWVELAAISDPSLVGGALADAVGVRPLPGRTPTDAVITALGEGRALVALDNCEHMLATVAEVVEAVLAGCPEVSVLVTSREPLSLPGETSWRVPSLSLPAKREIQTIVPLTQSDAVRLFVERALHVRPNFRVTNDNAPAVAQICHDLDGIPLAIELAAARTRLMSLDEIAARLGDRFQLLTGGARTALPRQRTLRASVDWSHELLDQAERTLLRRLGVFAGGFTLDAAEHVCGEEPLDRFAILDLLGSLVDKSLVQVEERDGQTRYRLLETVRHYAFDHLTVAGEVAALRDRHRDAFLELAERIEPELLGECSPRAVELLDADAANLHAAIDWAVGTDPTTALRLCSALPFWWFRRGRLTTGLAHFERALAACTERRSPLRGRALWGQAYLAASAAKWELTHAAATEALTLGEQLGDAWIQGRALFILSWIQVYLDPREAVATAERSREFALAANDDFTVLVALQAAFARAFQDDLVGAGCELDRASEVAERVGDRIWIGAVPYARGHLLLSSVANEQRRSLLERALALVRDRDPMWESLADAELGFLEVQTGEPERALERLTRCRERAVRRGAGSALAFVEFFGATAQAALVRLDEAGSALTGVANRRADGFSWLLGLSLAWLAAVERIRGDAAAARSCGEQAIVVADHVGSAFLGALARHELARLAAARGEWSEAERLAHDVLAALVDGGHRLHVPDSLEALAEVAAGLESFEEATRLLAAAERARGDLGIVRWFPEHEHLEGLERELRAALGDQAHQTAHAEGQALTLDDAIAYVRRARGSRKRPSGGWESLTPTELEVLNHAAAGLTNAEIAERMFISPATVKVHLAHIYAKLGIRNRAQLTAEAIRHQRAPAA